MHILQEKIMKISSVMGLAISLLILSVSSAGMAQEEPDNQVFAKAYEQGAVFCSYEASESGDSPDGMYLIINDELFYLEALMQTDQEFDLAYNILKEGSIVDIDMVFRRYWDESWGRNAEAAGVTRIREHPGLGGTSLCPSMQ